MDKKLTLNIPLTTVLVALMALGLGLGLGLWLPWANDSTTRTVTLDGSATIEVEPDEFVFRPSIEVTDPDEATAKQQAESAGTELAEAMKDLGVEENQLASNLRSYQVFNEQDQWRSIYQLTITVQDEDLSQNIYDALLGNETVGGNIDPTSQLSDTKRKEVEQTARTQAIADARQQAEQSAKELNKTLGEVVSVEDAKGFDRVRPLLESNTEDKLSTDRQGQFYSGTSEVTFTVKATFELN